MGKTTVSTLEQRVRMIRNWIMRRQLMGEVTTGDDTWREIHRRWPRITMNNAEYVFQKCGRGSHYSAVVMWEGVLLCGTIGRMN